MPESPSANPPHPPRSLVKQPEWAAALSKSQRRASVNRRAREQSRQHAVVATWLCDLVRKG